MDIEKKLDVLDWMRIHYLDRECLNKSEEKELNNFVNELKEAINYTRCCTELRDKEDPNYEFNKEDFKYSEFITNVGKEYCYVSNKAHYFINGTLTKILTP